MQTEKILSSKHYKNRADNFKYGKNLNENEQDVTIEIQIVLSMNGNYVCTYILFNDVNVACYGILRLFHRRSLVCAQYPWAMLIDY